jgi:hypothetical protein
MSASSARGHYANPPLEDEDDLIDPDDGELSYIAVTELSLYMVFCYELHSTYTLSSRS